MTTRCPDCKIIYEAKRKPTNGCAVCTKKWVVETVNMKLDWVKQLLQECKELAEQSGVSFEMRVPYDDSVDSNGVWISYEPESNPEDINKGWQSSEVCW